jgi:hypothetical protein
MNLNSEILFTEDNEDNEAGIRSRSSSDARNPDTSGRTKRRSQAVGIASFPLLPSVQFNVGFRNKSGPLP